MITKFSVLYVGQIELENIGIGGTPTDARRYGNERLVEAFATAKDVAQLMDELATTVCGRRSITSSARLRGATEPRHAGDVAGHPDQTPEVRLRLQHPPMWHPVRLAEDYAMADIVTNGRVIMGVGRGYHTREVESFGAPLLDTAANRELFEEQVEVMLKCFNEEAFSHRGKHYVIPPDVDYRGYRLREVTCVPRPHRPVAIWMPIGAERRSLHAPGLKRWSAHGEKSSTTSRALTGRVRASRTAEAAGEDLCWGWDVSARHEGRSGAPSEPYNDSATICSRTSDSSLRRRAGPKGPPGAPAACRAQGRNRPRKPGVRSARSHRRHKEMKRDIPHDQMMIHWAEACPPRNARNSCNGSLAR